MRKARYRPPYTVSGRAMGLMAEIGATLERYRILLEGLDGVRLRRVNHVRTLRGTTAIEGNTLSEEQITAILAGKRVAGSRREIAEVECAHRAYLEDREGGGKSVQKSRQKSDQKIADLMRERPEIMIGELSEATGLSASGVKKNIRKLKDANRIRRVGPDKGGHWEVA